MHTLTSADRRDTAAAGDIRVATNNRGRATHHERDIVEVASVGIDCDL